MTAIDTGAGMPALTEGTTSQMPDGAGGRTRLYVTIVFVLLLSATAATFAVLSRKQSSLEFESEVARTLRMSRQAVVEVDLAILDIITRRERAEFARYARAANRLALYGPDSFPASVNLDAREVASAPVVAGLKEVWQRIVEAARAGDVEAARTTYVGSDVGRTMSQLGESAVAAIERHESAVDALQRDIRIAIGVILILIFLTGLFAYRLSARRAERDRIELRAAMHGANAAREAANAAMRSAYASREQVTRLFEMTDMLQSAADHNDANAVLRATAAELIPDFGGALYIFNNSRDRLTLSVAWNREGAAELPSKITVQQCWSLKRGKPHINVPNSHKLRCEHDFGDDCMLEIPMIARGEILGLLQIYAPGPDGEERLLQAMSLGSALADAMSLALANIALRDKLRGQALRDPLTGLYNRRYMEDALQRVVRLAERERTEVSVVMIDLDHFKRLNDNFGHAKGDSVLRDASAVLLNQLRETDIVCRYGGEELLVVLPNCGLDMAAVKAERLRHAIEGLSEPNGAQVSASMGVSSIPTTSSAMRDLLSSADAALYEAKQQGRNRVIRAPRLPMPVPSSGAPTLELVAAE